jgi:kanamycin kinase/aminoglycoside 3'-phosphotransferase-2
MSIPSVPSSLLPLVADCTWTPIGVGESRSNVYRLDGSGRVAYLKIAPVSPFAELLAERERLGWLRGRLPVPRVLGYAAEDGRQYLLLSAIPGIDTSSSALDMGSLDMVRLLARGLLMVHDVPIRDCPFDMTLDLEIPRVERNVALDLVDEEDFDLERLGGSPGALFQVLVATRPATEDLVFTHGDYCLPNILIDDGEISGFVDMGRAGVADRYKDIALAVRSIRRNCGDAFVQAFLDEYGVQRSDAGKVEYYMLLDEFW